MFYGNIETQGTKGAQWTPMKSQSQILKSLSPQKFSLRHPLYDISASVRNLSEQLFGFTSNHHLETSIENVHNFCVFYKPLVSSDL